MSHLGKRVKEQRLKKGLTQIELAEDICTQATISNLENETSLPSLSILLAVGDRLNIDFSDIYEFVSANSTSYSDIFKQVQKYCETEDYKEAYKILKEQIDFSKLESVYELKQYYYYVGITSLLGYQRFSDAHYNLNLALSSDSGRNLDFFDVMATNGIGIAYDLISDKEKAQTYFEKTLVLLDEVLFTVKSSQNRFEIVKIYFNIAKFYSSIEDYQQAIDLSDLGIRLLEEEKAVFYLDHLFYEKSLNLSKLGQQEKATENYFYAAALAKISKNTELYSTIKKGMTEFKIEGYNYWA
ncbi:MAG: helix-turn-helix transcriptional regulator [Carnobacterium sp.]|jgi:transcriptional regulator with XRE-family HTH domain|uniref:helix-turn-helix domain-containing protein n=1 Tax=Carnobacterium TaxID=2747 RepID=UPI000E70B294|nr:MULTISPECIES: helix-turn-helix transcriptional regulator [Carnobacterium]AOA02834.1 transcriptional regulator [Carnobacterium maltaromaticum]MBQ6485567.1 helix-turn-helix transcriptional regulator [Carnobacterium sp.]MCI1819607.1 helix-turn-helix domain-containing protein [Carnobacterium maltaromaticum]